MLLVVLLLVVLIIIVVYSIYRENKEKSEELMIGYKNGFLGDNRSYPIWQDSTSPHGLAFQDNGSKSKYYMGQLKDGNPNGYGIVYLLFEYNLTFSEVH